MNSHRSVVLVYPRLITGWQAQPWCDLPLDLLSVASPLYYAGYRVRIIDQRVTPEWRKLFKEELESRPLCVGVTCCTGPQIQHALEVSRLAKEFGNIPVVWGGIHASLLPQQVLARGEIDFVVQGEGEETFLELVQALEDGKPLDNIAGLWFKENGQVKPAPERPFIDLNEQPPLAYDLVDVSRYTRTVFDVKRLSFSTSRGCCFQCAFCYNTVFHHRKWRALHADVAIERIADFVRRYATGGLFLTDANFFLDMDRARHILEGISRLNLGIVFSRLHIRFDTLAKMTDEDFALLERAGCKCLAMGIESGSARIQQLLRKPIDLPLLLELNRKLRSFSIAPLYFFMMGFPTETLQELRETVSLFTLLTKENPRAIKSLNIYTPYPGTELFDFSVAQGFQPPRELEDWIPFHYRNLGGQRGWLSKKMRRVIEMLDFCSFFVGDRNLVDPFKKTNPVVVELAKIYAPLARKRVEHFFYAMPIEIKLAKGLGLYARQK